MRKWILIALLSLQISSLNATTFLVTTANDSGPGSLRNAIDLARTGDTIQITPLGSPIFLSTNLPTIEQSITINADNSQVISGNSVFRVFATNQASLILNNIVVENGLAQGGTGGSGLAYSGGGGGGLGAGGGIYVDLGQTLTLSNTTITQSIAQGGNGGDGTSNQLSLVLQGGGGGGASWSVLSNNGGTSFGGGDYPGGGSGIVNRGGDPHEGGLGYGGGNAGEGGVVGSGGIGGGNENGVSINGASNSGANGGYAGGGGGGGGIAAGGGGNGGGEGGDIANAYFGGGGGGYGSGGSGGYVTDSAFGAGGGGGGLGGGGGGGTGGGNNGGGGGGGFGAGGGGGGSDSGGVAGEGGNFGGRGGDGGSFSIAGGGGGGAGLGGGIFVGDSAILNIANDVTLTNNQAIGGAGGNGGDFNGSSGVGYAPDVFLFQGAILNFIGTDPSQNISFVIASDPNAPADHQDGGVTKNGTGTVILTSSNNYLGDTNVNSGKLVLNGSIAKDVIVNSGGVLSGTGTVGGDLIINSGGASAPGNSIGTLNVNGDYTQHTDSAYQLQINLTDSTLLNITGIAFLGGEAIITPINNLFTPNHSYLILQASGGVEGNFELPRFSETSLYVPFLIYDATHVYLVISPLSIARYPLLQNTLGVGHTIDSIVNAIFNNNFNLQGDLLSAIEQLTLYYNAIEVNNILKTFTPVVDGAFIAQSFNAARFVFGLASERMLIQHFADSGYRSGDINNTHYGSWLKVFGQYAKQDSRDGVDGYKDNMNGIAVGSDITVDENAVLGLALSWANVDIHHFVSDGKTTVNSYQFTAYGEYDFNCPWYITVLGGIAHNNYETQRQITSGIVLLSPQGEFDGWQYSVKGEMGYDYKIDNIHIIPLISLFYSHLNVEGYTETGAGNAGLIVKGQDFDTCLGGLGIKLAQDVLFGEWMLQAEGHMIAYDDFKHEGIMLTSQFIGAGPSFITSGINAAPTLWDIGGGLTVINSVKGWILSGTFDIEFTDNYWESSGFLKIRYEW